MGSAGYHADKDVEQVSYTRSSHAPSNMKEALARGEQNRAEVDKALDNDQFAKVRSLDAASAYRVGYADGYRVATDESYPELRGDDGNHDGSRS